MIRSFENDGTVTLEFGAALRAQYPDATSCACVVDGRNRSPDRVSKRMMNFGQHWRLRLRRNRPVAVIGGLIWAAVSACQPNPGQDSLPGRGGDTDPYAEERSQMVERQLRGRDIRDRTVLAAMAKVPRHRFVPNELQSLAYADRPLPIGFEQTISQPYIVAYMTEAAEISGGDRVLEIGTGSGYQAAVLAELAREVYTIEIIPELAARARGVLEELGSRNVHVRAGDGYLGWPGHAPFDAIVVTAAPDHVPPALVQQLAVNGRMVIPVGTGEQEMRIITKTATGVTEEKTLPVRFVPLVRPEDR